MSEEEPTFGDLLWVRCPNGHRFAVFPWETPARMCPGCGTSTLSRLETILHPLSEEAVLRVAVLEAENRALLRDLSRLPEQPNAAGNNRG